MRTFLATEAAWPVKFFPGRCAAGDNPVVTSMPVMMVMSSCEKLREGDVELNYRQVRPGAL
eukprot:7657709-Alexandrium_andersonii.AAC.1